MLEELRNQLHSNFSWVYLLERSKMQPPTVQVSSEVCHTAPRMMMLSLLTRKATNSREGKSHRELHNAELL